MVSTLTGVYLLQGTDDEPNGFWLSVAELFVCVIITQGSSQVL